jgi:hypothetical protein
LGGSPWFHHQIWWFHGIFLMKTTHHGDTIMVIHGNST